MEQNNQLANAGKLYLGAWQLWKNNWRALTTTAIIPSLIYAFAQILAGFGTISGLFFGVIAIVAAFAFYVLMQIAILRTVKHIRTGDGSLIDVQSAYSASANTFWPYVWVSLLNSAMTMSIMALVFLPIFILSNVTIVTLGLFGSIFAAVLMSVGAIMMIGILLHFALAPYALVIADKRGLEAIVESLRLIRGRLGQVFWRFLVIGIMTVLVNVLAVGIEVLLSTVFGWEINSTPALVISMIFNLVVVSTAYPVCLIYLYDFYRSLETTAKHYDKPLIDRTGLKVLAWIGAVVTFILIMATIFVGMLSFIILMLAGERLDREGEIYWQDAAQVRHMPARSHDDWMYRTK